MKYLRACAAAAALTSLGCSDRFTNASAVSLNASATKFWEANATVRWNAIARDQTLSHAISQQFGSRTFAYLSLAQYHAVVALEDANDRGDRASVQAAVAGASAVVLASFYPDQAAYFDAQVAEQAAEETWPGEQRTDFAAGEAIGRSVGAAVVASAATDGFTNSTAGVVVPVCPGCWFSAPDRVPVFPLLGQMRPFFLTTGSQFRPDPPPAFGSVEFLAALAEVRQFSDTRTPEQIEIARFWASPGGFTNVAQAYNNQIATEEITKFHLDERRAAHVLAVMNMAAMDAFIACHDAKYVYWLLRPTHADPGIVLAIGLPNHPSYPSNHACITGSSMAVLASFFPAEADHLNGLAAEAGISRIYGGIHYRFDVDAGLVLARTIAQYAIARDINGHEAYPLK
jgi:membrane-associated phospholipid phosphatase